MSISVIKRLNWLPELYDIERRSQDYPWTESVLRSCFEDSHYESWGVFCPNVCGFVITHSVLDERTIMNLVVDPACRGKGYGRDLVRQVQLSAQQHQQSVWLEVRASNTVAQALYRSVGFETIAERADYYRTADGSEAAVVMRWISANSAQ
ncbi:MAG TPA: ribosomal protein S18-alanine N-acetyltransferase [Pseudidiomarina sp.]|nr:ribosomal protein S18-alanine N-acetyltransferase [Pseudidiomarina sp.]